MEPKLDVFRLAIAMGLDRHREHADKSPHSFIFAMPMEGHEARWKVPTADLIAGLTRQIETENYFIDLLSAWVGDFQTEMQMLLLSELFPNKVERRDPPDPDQFCLRLDRYDDVRRRIEGTDWGRRMVEMEAEASGRFAGVNERE